MKCIVSPKKVPIKTATIGIKYVTLLANNVVELIVNLLNKTTANEVPTIANIDI